MIVTGRLANLVKQGVRGVTANPATFAKAIIESNGYDHDIERAAKAGRSTEEIYEQLIITDVRDACDILRPAYDESNGLDGFVSLEVSPHLAHDTEGSINEARRLFAAVDRPNLFIKIPGTLAGVPAIGQLLADGININITLLFSVPRYEAVARAYVNAIGRRLGGDKPLGNLASVASFFLSRIDVLVDQLLEKRAAAGGAAHGLPHPKKLLGKIAVANAKLAYQSCKRIFADARWRGFRSCGAQIQRLLWASTGTKNPAYPKLMYVEPLIGSRYGPMTINTMPEKTIAAFLDHGKIRETIEDGVEDAARVMADLGRLGIDFENVAAQLEDVGIRKFIEPLTRRCATYRRSGNTLRADSGCVASTGRAGPNEIFALAT